jgi:hypothetical protein
VEAWADGDVVFLSRLLPGTETLAVFNTGEAPFTPVIPPGPWRRLLDSSDERWSAAGALSGAAPAAPETPLEDPASQLQVRGTSFVLLARPRSG